MIPIFRPQNRRVAIGNRRLSQVSSNRLSLYGRRGVQCGGVHCRGYLDNHINRPVAHQVLELSVVAPRVPESTYDLTNC